MEFQDFFSTALGIAEFFVKPGSLKFHLFFFFFFFVGKIYRGEGSDIIWSMCRILHNVDQNQNQKPHPPNCQKQEKREEL